MAAADLIKCGNAALPRSIDVNVTISKPQSEQTTDLSVAVFVQAGFGSTSFGFGADRVAFFSSYEALAADARISAEGLKAGRDFFAQPKRARLMAVGQVFTAAQKGFVKTGAIGTLSAFQAVTNGSFAISVDGINRNLSSLNFSTDTTLAQVATRIQTALVTAGATGATVAVSGSQVVITSGTSGDASMVSVLGPVTPAAGTDISGPGFLNGRLGVAVTQAGYQPGNLPSELDLIAQAAKCGGRFVYGWFLDAAYRDSPAQALAGAWAQAHTAAMPLVSNSPLAWDPASANDIGPVSLAAGQFRVFPLYHDKAEYYPDGALLAVVLSVDYAQKNSTITAKFKDLVGIPTVGITESQYITLDAKGYNTFTLTGNTSRVFREGGTANASWFIDDLTNLDNYREELQVAVYNVFLRNNKVGYNAPGVTLLRAAMVQVSERYVFNNTLSDRQVIDLTAPGGEVTSPAYNITFTPLAQMTVADRAARRGPPAVIDANLTGAIHSIAINVNAYS